MFVLLHKMLVWHVAHESLTKVFKKTSIFTWRRRKKIQFDDNFNKFPSLKKEKKKTNTGNVFETESCWIIFIAFLRFISIFHKCAKRWNVSMWDFVVLKQKLNSILFLCFHALSKGYVDDKWRRGRRHWSTWENFLCFLRRALALSMKGK